MFLRKVTIAGLVSVEPSPTNGRHVRIDTSGGVMDPAILTEQDVHELIYILEEAVGE